MPTPVFTVDAFTSRPFRGNPAAVCLLDEAADVAWMQQVAAEMNLSETAFVHPAGEGYGLRWFTPEVEVDLCGHATLATAHVLWETGRAAAGEVLTFATASGRLAASRRGALVELDLPSEEPEEAAAPAGLAEALGAPPRWTGRTSDRWLVELADAGTVADLRPDMPGITALGVQGVVVTARGGRPGHDVTSRYFAPSIGIPEDPVTGAAHCNLAPYWAPRLGRTEFVGFQASQRGGEVRMRLDGDRVVLGGHAVTVVAGTLLAG